MSDATHDGRVGGLSLDCARHRECLSSPRPAAVVQVPLATNDDDNDRHCFYLILSPLFVPYPLNEWHHSPQLAGDVRVTVATTMTTALSGRCRRSVLVSTTPPTPDGGLGVASLPFGRPTMCL